MNRFIAHALMLASGCVAFAATPGSPSFNSFNTGQFSTTGSRVALKDGVLVTNLVVHGESTSDSTATGSEFFGDGGSFGYRITPPTMSGFINFIPDTSAQTGVPYHTAIGTNVYETHLPLIWTNSAGTIQATSTVTNEPSSVGFLLNNSNPLSDSGPFFFELQNDGTNSTAFGQGSLFLNAANTLNVYGNFGPGIFSYNNGENNIAFGSSDGTNYNQLSFGSSVSGSSLNLSIDYFANGISRSIVLASGNSTNDGQFIISEGRNLVEFLPLGSDGMTIARFDSSTTRTSGNLFEIANNNANQFTVNNLGGLTTGLPTGATNAQPFKIGSEANAVGLVLVATNYIQIELNGVAYKLGLVK